MAQNAVNTRGDQDMLNGFCGLHVVMEVFATRDDTQDTNA